jgi:hypothetical protein
VFILSDKDRRIQKQVLFKALWLVHVDLNVFELAIEISIGDVNRLELKVMQCSES